VFQEALLTQLSVDDDRQNSGMLRASLRIEEHITAYSRSVQVKAVRSVRRKSKHKPKVQTGQKFAEKIAAVQAGSAETL
jgi:hypothetical protein